MFHAIGGEEKNNISHCTFYDIPITDVEAYNEDNNTWTEETSLPSARYRFSAGTVGNNFYIFGGQGLVQNNVYPVLNTVDAWEDTDAATAATFHPSWIVSFCFAFGIWILSI